MKIAVIIPAHNEEQVIEATIQALRLAGKELGDIYVVDDASKDATSDIARKCGVRLLQLADNVGKSTALNKATEHFALCDRYDYIAFLDADTKVHGDYFRVLMDAAQKGPDVSLFLGQVKSMRGTYITALRTLEYQIGHDLYKTGQSIWGTVFVAPGCASLYRSDVLRGLRYDGGTLAEDMDLTIQVQRRRGRIVYVPKAVVYTQDPATFKDYKKQVLRWQRGGWQVVKKHRILLLGKGQRVDIMLFVMMLDALLLNRFTVTIPLTMFLSKYQLFLGVCMEVFLLCSMALYAGIKNRRADVIYKLPLYFWIFYVIQFTYIQTFFEVMFKKDVMPWTRVKRY